MKKVQGYLILGIFFLALLFFLLTSKIFAADFELPKNDTRSQEFSFPNRNGILQNFPTSTLPNLDIDKTWEFWFYLDEAPDDLATNWFGLCPVAGTTNGCFGIGNNDYASSTYDADLNLLKVYLDTRPWWDANVSSTLNSFSEFKGLSMIPWNVTSSAIYGEGFEGINDGNFFWFDNLGNLEGVDTNIKNMYFRVSDGFLVEDISSSTIDYLYGTSTSPFFVDCTNYDGDGFLNGPSSTIAEFGCQLRKAGMAILGALVLPPDWAQNYLKNSILAIKNQFPFSVVFGLTDSVETAIANPSSTQAISVPIYGHGEFEIISSTTLSDVAGVDMKNQIFTFIEWFIWLATGATIFAML